MSVGLVQVTHVRVRQRARTRPSAVLAALPAERLDDRVAAHRVGQCPAQAAVPCVGTPRRGRDVVERQLHRDHHIEDGADADGEVHQRPMPAEQESRADKHDERRPQRHEHGVVQHVEGPHAAAQLAHRGAGEAVGMPVGREALNAPEGLARHFTHHAQGEAYDALEQAPAQDHQGNAEAEDRGERLSASTAAASRCRAESARASIIWPAKIGRASSAAAISTRPAAMASARRHCRRHRPATNRIVRKNGSFPRSSSARSHCSMPRPRRGEGPQKVVRAHAAMKRGNVRRREWSEDGRRRAARWRPRPDLMPEALEVRYAADGNGGVGHDRQHQRLPGWGCIKGAHRKIASALRQGCLNDS